MPAFLGPLLAGLGAWLAMQIGYLLVWVSVSLLLMYTDFGMDLIYRMISVSGYDVSALVLPEWREEWTEAVCVANAWVPIAEAWVIFKLYWSMKVSSITVKWTTSLIGMAT